MCVGLFINLHKKDIHSSILFACVCKAVGKLEGQETGREGRKLLHSEAFSTVLFFSPFLTVYSCMSFDKCVYLYHHPNQDIETPSAPENEAFHSAPSSAV